ncbi:hypothetical protein ACFQ60_32840 [Streptomyces zhihengii]
MRRENTREVLTDLALWAVLALCVLLRSDPDDGGSWWWVATGVPLLGAAVLLCRTAPLVSLGIAVALSAWQTPELFTASYAPAMAAFGYLSGRRTATARPRCSPSARRPPPGSSCAWPSATCGAGSPSWSPCCWWSSSRGCPAATCASTPNWSPPDGGWPSTWNASGRPPPTASGCANAPASPGTCTTPSATTCP